MQGLKESLQGQFTKETTIVGGTKSNYVRAEKIDLYRKVFPNLRQSDIIMVNSGHNVHVEQY